MRSQRHAPRGFTMVELLAVVAMVGILAAIAMVGYRSYMNASKTGDAKAIIGAIRIAEENHRAETLSYLDCSNGNLSSPNWFPAKPDGKRRHFINPAHGDIDCWRMLNVTTDSPTTFGFAVVAGGPGSVPPQLATQAQPTWPNPTTEPWYVVEAAGDQDGDQKFSILVSSSFTGEIYVENEAE